MTLSLLKLGVSSLPKIVDIQCCVNELVCCTCALSVCVCVCVHVQTAKNASELAWHARAPMHEVLARAYRVRRRCRSNARPNSRIDAPGHPAYAMRLMRTRARAPRISHMAHVWCRAYFAVARTWKEATSFIGITCVCVRGGWPRQTQHYLLGEIYAI